VTAATPVYAAQRRLQLCATVILAALIGLTLTWELWLAPLRPGGSWFIVKTLPLLLPLRGIVRGRIYTYRWSTMLILAYFTEGAVRAYAEPGIVAALGAIEITLSMGFFVTAIAYVRVARAAAGDAGARRPV
jgi:uncharacterized membrane protein